jgi:hypothetical protein
MVRILLAVILVLSCGAADAATLCPFDTPACRMMPDRYIAPQMAPDGSYVSGNRRPYSDPPIYNYPQRYQAPQMAPDGSYPGDEE